MLIQKLRDGSEGVLGKILIGVVLIIFGFFGFGWALGPGPLGPARAARAATDDKSSTG